MGGNGRKEQNCVCARASVQVYMSFNGRKMIIKEVNYESRVPEQYHDIPHYFLKDLAQWCLEVHKHFTYKSSALFSSL
jgi:hypothetical protein